ncbi:MAG: class I SAM-dependent methyltransferase [Smithellaceae bacterium]|nr:class I SAM-dependent methyltransferase [Smithellaceae bacterium]
MGSYFVNTTNEYHTLGIETLGWELTVCNALEPQESICRTVLQEPFSYGKHLYRFLSRSLTLEKVRDVIEIGGGYGYIMRDLLLANSEFHATMLDISPYLLGQQRKLLPPERATFINEDFLTTADTFLCHFDLAILNENLGDFPTLVGVDRPALDHGPAAGTLSEMIRLSSTYKLDIPELPSLNFNTGAILALEKLCHARIPYIFLCEHSCEAEVPSDLRHWVKISNCGNPERISLKGHNEYSLKFSHLERVGRWFGYDVRRGPLADYLKINWSDTVKTALQSQVILSDRQEVIRQFVEDLFKYEYLLLDGSVRTIRNTD